MEEENIVDLDYKTKYKRLQEKYCADIAELKEKHLYEINEICSKYEEKLNMNEEKWRGVVNTQQEEIKWLKSIIKGILHIS